MKGAVKARVRITTFVLCRNSQEQVGTTTNTRKTASKIATNGSLTMNKKLSNGGLSAGHLPPARQTLVGGRLWPEEALDEDTVDDVDSTDADIEHYATLRLPLNFPSAPNETLLLLQ